MNLSEILKKHEMWLNNEKGGERANLSGYDLININLSGADLINANLRDVDLSGANLKNIILRGADLRNANLKGANLKGANLINANLRNVDLYNTDLNNVDLSDADLRNANLKGANLKGIKTNTNTIGYHLACPEEGPFIGYKTAGKYLIKLLIPEDAKRSSATTYKCRCNKAKVLSITNIKTGIEVWEARSNYDSSFRYEVGKVVSVDNFDDNRWNECAPGIHFFMNRENAINY